MTEMIKNLLEDTKTRIIGDTKKDEIERETVVVVIYNKIKNQYLCQFWPEYNGLTCLLSGGVERGENHPQTISREIIEETGYTDFSLLGKLGGDIETHYTKNNGQHFVKHISAYFVILNSFDKQNESKEEDEKFDNLLLESEEIFTMMEAYEAVSGSSLDDHKQILKRAIQYQDRFRDNR